MNYNKHSEHKNEDEHNHSHHSHHHYADIEDFNKGSAVRKALVAAIILNIGFVIVEAAFGFAFNSVSLLSDAVHNLGDVFSLFLSWLAIKLLRYPNTAKYTYGMKKGTVIASVANAVILLATVALIFHESISKLCNPEPTEGFGIMVVAAVGVLINGVSAWLLLRHTKRDLNVRGAYLHLLSDALVSIGVVVGGIVIMLTDFFIIDALIGILIGCVILISTWKLLIDSVNLALDAVPEGISSVIVQKAMADVENVVSVHHLHIWSLSTTETALTSHIVIRDFATLEQTKNELKHRLNELNVQHITLEFETENTECSDEDCK
ncbi:MAG: cation diffusion facilitator family transporter [Bacteroidales bacterium]|jgi:cobalt-zinc-cadmium efflux system protein|nr:cation diffusion facilitator family transporter [Bacteroidales bacterium]